VTSSEPVRLVAQHFRDDPLDGDAGIAQDLMGRRFPGKAALTLD
jgi:hypothetical protein